ncbi:hypothetical protein HYW75_03845 [Candidatus Pacearchaeota archaeon]|nr:hypothetical protein [Candidatus Pacearchaeota archaeon]
MGFGRTERERQLVLIVNARGGEKLIVNDSVMIRTDDIAKFNSPSQSFMPSARKLTAF